MGEGNSGRILDGSSGETTLEGGSFTVTKVVDEHKSIAKTQLRSIGRNTRVTINVAK